MYTCIMDLSKLGLKLYFDNQTQTTFYVLPSNNYVYVYFLFDFDMLFVDEDIKLNSQVFHWPENIKAVFELSQNRILTKREHIEEELRTRTKAYEEKLNDMMKEVESFKKKEVYKQ